MDFTELGFLIGFIIVSLNIIVINHKTIQKIKSNSVRTFLELNKEKNKNIKKAFVTIGIENIQDDISNFEKKLREYILIGIIGNVIFYFFLSTINFYICFVINTIIILSYSSIRANQIKFLNQLKDFYEANNY